MEYFNLNNGNKLPQICFGPGIMTRGKNLNGGRFVKRVKYKILEYNYYHSILSAIENGARFIDYSAAYGREDIIKKAITHSGIGRDNFYLTTRVNNAAQYQGTVRETILRSIERFGSDYVDLLMFHWPVTDKYVDTWKELIKIQEEGLCKNIGVANCHSHHIEKIIQATSVVPVVNQVEIHPLFSQKKLINYCKSKAIQMEAYTPLARMDDRMTNLPLLKAISKKTGKSISQIVLRWHIQNGVIPVFRSLNSDRQKENFDIFDFELSEEDMLGIDSININSRLRYDPDNCDFTIL